MPCSLPNDVSDNGPAGAVTVPTFPSPKGLFLGLWGRGRAFSPRQLPAAVGRQPGRNRNRRRPVIFRGQHRKLRRHCAGPRENETRHVPSGGGSACGGATEDTVCARAVQPGPLPRDIPGRGVNVCNFEQEKGREHLGFKLSSFLHNSSTQRSQPLAIRHCGVVTYACLFCGPVSCFGNGKDFWHSMLHSWVWVWDQRKFGRAENAISCFAVQHVHG